jgi:phage major head subunit gpT-like protein
MADNSGQAEIRGLDIDKLAKGFAEEEMVLKRFVSVTKTSAREIRWYKKTAGFLTGTTTTGITGNRIDNVAERALPSVVEQSWTRQTSYVRKYFVESPTLSMEDIKDADIDVLATNVRDLVRAVANRVDTRIFNVLSESLSPSDINTTAATDTGS